MSTSEPLLFAGVDVGAGRLDAAMVAVPGDGSCRYVASFAGSVDELPAFCDGAVRVAVDAPGGLSAGAHRADASVAPKFRSGRCSEIPIPGRPPVPWVTPATMSALPGWMRTGFAVWAALGSAGLEVVETFPAATFHQLHGGRWPPPKTTAAGRATRLALLSELVDLPSSCLRWSHDQVDAVACALTAARGRPARHVCDRPDGSAMWVLPGRTGSPDGSVVRPDGPVPRTGRAGAACSFDPV